MEDSGAKVHEGILIFASAHRENDKVCGPDSTYESSI